MEKNTSKQTNAQPAQPNENVIAALAYLIFFLPLIVTPNSKLGRYHATQAAHLFLYGIATVILSTIFFPLALFMPFVQLGLLVLGIMGFMNAYKGEMKPVPLIGEYTFFKL